MYKLRASQSYSYSGEVSVEAPSVPHHRDCPYPRGKTPRTRARRDGSTPFGELPVSVSGFHFYLYPSCTTTSCNEDL